MSFSANVKTELCKANVSRRCCAVAESYGVLLTCGRFSPSGIRIVTEHAGFAERLIRLFRRAFDVTFDGETEPTESGKFVYVIEDPQKIAAIYDSFGLDARGNVMLHLNRSVVENECCQVAFLRGAFLCGGSVTDPEKRYHLEITTTHAKVAAELFSFLLDMDFSPKQTSRAGECVLYFKHSDQIEDILTTIGAPVCAMAVMEAKVEKTIRNNMNRRCNCDDANITKVVDAAQEQLAAIRKLRECGRFDTLSPKLREIALLREEEPEAALSELAEKLGLTKSAVQHRLKKLLDLAQ